MSYELSWVIENRVTYSKFMGEMTVEEIEEANRVALNYIQQAPREVLFHSIIDTREVTTFPINLKVFTSEVQVQFRQQPNLGWLLVISHNKMISFIGSVMAGMSKARFRIFQMPEEAIAFLKEQDLTLDWSQAHLPEMVNNAPGAQ